MKHAGRDKEPDIMIPAPQIRDETGKVDTDYQPKSQPLADMRNSTTQPFAGNNVLTKVAFDVVLKEAHGGSANLADNRIDITEDGLYVVVGYLRTPTAGSSLGGRVVTIRHNGVEWRRTSANATVSGAETMIVVSANIPCSAGDTLEMWAAYVNGSTPQIGAFTRLTAFRKGKLT